MGFGNPSRGYPAWSLDEEVSRALIRHATEAGINFFDTANMYSNGSSEEIVGKALKDFSNRDSVVIATKLSAPTRHGPNALGLSRKAVMTEAGQFVAIYAVLWERVSVRFCSLSVNPLPFYLGRAPGSSDSAPSSQW